ncbi:phage replisome organizer N-terminal domain-containing protein [Candidatus Avoscillospira sp. LCP25S3_F1]|uniref:phage replisome organizer N-terminal domain-containing protein n=1 Tax=Candidatus Avoscillospira sp. LCP25S3_F1 TaxID=3438825 RepID=UPI003F8DE754
MAKRYYWLKLQEDFFASPRIKKLRRIAGGDTFTIIYLKLQLLSVKSGGLLVHEGIESKFSDELALRLDEDADNVAVTLNFLLANGLMEQSDEDKYILPQAVQSIGSEGESAARMRALRARPSQCDAIVIGGDKKVTTDIDRDKEIDIEKDTTLHTAAVTTRAPAREESAAAAAAVIAMYHAKLGRAPSEDCAQELVHFLSTMDAACIERAINIAIDAGAPRWNYIRSILQDKQKKGVRCLADWDRLIANATHQQPPPPQTGRRPPAGSAGMVPLGELEQQALDRMLSHKS